MTSQTATADCFSPAQVAERVEKAGIAKSNLGFWKMFALAILAGLFIGLGAEFYTLVSTGIEVGFGLKKLIGGLVFSLGLVLVVVAGAELFTGNNLLTMALISRAAPARRVLRNWVVVFLGNLVGSVALAWMLFVARQWTSAGMGVGVTAINIAAGKVTLPFWTALMRGALCNFLVCLAVWLCFSARSVTDKIMAIIFPITAFVASGFEHSVANMYFIPFGLLLKGEADVVAAAQLTAEGLNKLTISGFLGNLIPVTIGNLLGGGLMVGAMYWFIYLRSERPEQAVQEARATAAFTLWTSPEGMPMLKDSGSQPGYALCSYVLASGDMFYGEAAQRFIYLSHNPDDGFRVRGEIPGQGQETAVDLAQILLEYSMTCKAISDLPDAYRQMDRFGARLGEALALHIIEGTPAKTDAHRCYSALECVLDSMHASFTVQEVKGNLQYTLPNCPLCEAADRSGVRHVRLAHHGLNAVCQRLLDGIAPDYAIQIPFSPTAEHVFSVIAPPADRHVTEPRVLPSPA